MIFKSSHWLILVCISVLSSCAYNFKGISIPPDVNTFAVENFTLQTLAAPQGVEIRFTERLRDKVRNESRLKYNEEAPDIIFSGKVTQYTIQALSPEEGSTSAFNKLTIMVQVDYDSNLNDDDKWTKQFSFFSDFDANSDVSAIEDGLINDIFDQIVEQVFNHAFTDW